MFEIILLDLDDTILDFSWAEGHAIRSALQEFGIVPTEEICQTYRKINLAHWQALERRALTLEQVRVGRFRALLAALGKTGAEYDLADAYVHYLGRGHCFLPGAKEAVEGLSQKYRLFLVTNGNPPVQWGRLQSADLLRYFENIFISAELGANKPSREFFDRCFAQIPKFQREAALIVGDSLTSDIQGGKNASIATCWVNPKNLQAPENLTPDYQIPSLSQLEALLSAMRNETEG